MQRPPDFRRVLLLAVFAASCSAHKPPALPRANPEMLGLSEPALQRISKSLQSFVDSGKVSGVYAVVARHGQIGYESAIGRMDIHKHRPLKRDALFRIYSMTKPVVAAAAMRLVDQRKIRLDDAVAKYIPAFANVRVYAGGGAASPLLVPPDSLMTIRHVLTHTSGLGYGTTNKPADSIFIAARMYDASHTLEWFADSLAKLPLHFSPGTGFNYSSGLEVIGRIIEVVSGMPLDRFLEEELFEPLGMKDTSFRIRKRSRIPKLYRQSDDGTLTEVGNDGLQKMFEPDAVFLWASGGLLSTPDDYLRFTQMLLNYGELNGIRILSRESVHEMTRNQLPSFMTPLPTMLDGGYGYGLAGAVLVDPSKSRLPGTVGIYRWSGYVGTYFWIDRVNDMIAMVWTQLSPGRAVPLESEFQKLVYGALR